MCTCDAEACQIYGVSEEAAAPQDGEGNSVQRFCAVSVRDGLSAAAGPPQSFTLLILSQEELFPNLKMIAVGEDWLQNHHKYNICGRPIQ